MNVVSFVSDLLFTFCIFLFWFCCMFLLANPFFFDLIVKILSLHDVLIFQASPT